MKPTLWQQDLRISTLLVNPQQRLGLVGLLLLQQDAAWEHAGQLGFGRADLAQRGVYWVLTRQRLTMDAWPAWGAAVTLRTWSRPWEGFVARRDFELLQGGQRVGSCATEWLNLGLQTHRPVRLHAGEAAQYCRPGGALGYDPAKLDLQGDWQALAAFDVRNSDHDMQGHVNNVRYAQWVLDALPLAEHRAFLLRGYEANFLAETHLGDRIEVRAAPVEPGAEGLSARRFLGVRLGDGKTVFACRLLFQAAAVPVAEGN